MTPRRTLTWAIWATVMAAIGLLWVFPDAASRLRREVTASAAMAEGCALATQPCTARFPDGSEVTLSLSPRPVQSSSILTFQVQATGGLSPAALEIQGTSMNMGLVHLPLNAADVPDQYEARGGLPLCTANRMVWAIDVLLGEPVAQIAAFSLVTGATGEARSVSAPSPHTASSPDAPEATFGDFTVTTRTGELALSSLRGHVVVVTFGYTSCPDVCPTTLASLGAAMALLDDATRSKTTVLFVSVDPERDSPERLGAYAAYFDEGWHGGHLPPERLAAVAADWGVVYRRVDDPGSAMAYTMDHSTQAFLVDSAGRHAGQLPHGLPAADIAHAIGAIGNDAADQAAAPPTPGARP